MAPPSRKSSTMRSPTFARPEQKDLTVQAVRDLRIIFACFQKTDRVLINIHQLADIVELLGDPRPPISDLRKLITETFADPSELDGDDTISFKKFVRFFVFRLHGINVEVRAREIFRALDCDDSGEVSAAEIQESLKVMGLTLNTDEVLAMTSTADTSKDGEINYNQFRQIWRRIDSELVSHDKASQKELVKTSHLLRLVGNHARWKMPPPMSMVLTHPERLFNNAPINDDAPVQPKEKN